MFSWKRIIDYIGILSERKTFYEILNIIKALGNSPINSLILGLFAIIFLIRIKTSFKLYVIKINDSTKKLLDLFVWAKLSIE